MNHQEFLHNHFVDVSGLRDYIEKEERKNIFNAPSYQGEVKSAFLGFEDNETKGDKLPWSKARDVRFRSGELTIWTGYNGHKKSMVLGQVCLGFLAKQKRSLIISPEMKPVKTLKRMIRQYVGVAEPTAPYQEKFFKFCKSNLWFYDQTGTLQSDKVIALLYYLADQVTWSHVFIDSLMKMGINEDDYNGQKRFVDELTTFAKDADCHVHLVAHAKKTASEFEPPQKYDAAGSANISNLADNVIVVFENKKEERNYDNMLLCKKQRNYEGEGDAEPSYFFWFDEKSLQFKPKKDYPTMNDEDWEQPKWL